MRIGSIGLGLIGGSFALALRKYHPEATFCGFDSNSDHLQQALDLKIVDEILTDEVIPLMDLVVVSIPVDKAYSAIVDVLEKVSSRSLVMDMGSTKGKLCLALDEHPRRSQFLAAHPIAGTEFSGPEAAFTSLFQNKTMIFCDVKATQPQLLEFVKDLILPLQMHIKYMDANEHDKHLAYVSHLSHISSFMLGKTVLEVEQNDKTVFELAGSGFASTVRLAKSNPVTWAAIFKENQTQVLQALEEYIENLTLFHNQLKTQNYSEIHQQLANANALKPILNGILKKENHEN